MKLTLRKANAVQLGINDIVKGLKFETSVTLNEFQNVDNVLAESATRFMTNLNRRKALTEALRDIRIAVGQANGQAGIDNRLAEIAHLEKQIQFFNGIATTEHVRESMDVVKGKLDKIRNRKEESRLYGYNDSVATGVFFEGDIESFKSAVKDMKKAKQKLQDEVLELNVRTEIELSDTVAEILTKEGLL
jgi:hypothetical protein